MQGAPSTYALTAVLAGFDSITIEKISANVGGEVHIPVTLKVGKLCEVTWVDQGWEESLRRADLVALVRIESSSSNREPDSPNYCVYSTDNVATVIDTIKGTNAGSAKLPFSMLVDPPGIILRGSEYIAFLQWDTSVGKYQASTPYFIPVEAGLAQKG
jgi:hypothetical protein